MTGQDRKQTLLGKIVGQNPVVGIVRLGSAAWPLSIVSEEPCVGPTPSIPRLITRLLQPSCFASAALGGLPTAPPNAMEEAVRQENIVRHTFPVFRAGLARHLDAHLGCRALAHSSSGIKDPGERAE